MAEHCDVCLSRLMTHLEQTWQNIAMCVCLDSSGADVAEHCNGPVTWQQCCQLSV